MSGVFGSPTRPASRSVSSRQREGIPRRYLCTRHTGTWPFQRLASLAAVDWPHRGARRRAAAPGPSAPWAARTRGGVRPSSHGSAAPDLQRRAQRGLKDGSRRGAEASARASAEGAQAKSAVARASSRAAHARSAGGTASASASAEGAHARSAEGPASASTSALGADARSAGARASARTSAEGAIARSAGARASVSTSANGTSIRIAERKRTSRCRLAWRSSRKLACECCRI